MAPKTDQSKPSSSSSTKHPILHPRKGKSEIAKRAEERLVKNDDRIDKLEKKVDLLLSKMSKDKK